MIGRHSKCETCKKFALIDEAPWASCQVFGANIPPTIYQVLADGEKAETSDSAKWGKNQNCKDYEFNPNWKNAE